MARGTTERSFDELARGLAEGSISRRRALGLFASSAVAALLPSTRALADDDDHDGYTVCHVPGTPPNCDCTRARTIRGLSRRERNRHLRNHPCDSRGNCRNNPYCGTTTTTTSTTTSTSTSTSTTSTSTTPAPGECTGCGDACGDLVSCVCVPTADAPGSTVCVKLADVTGQGCTSSSQCPTGRVCVAASCAGLGNFCAVRCTA